MKGKKIITPEIEKKIITLRKKKIGAPLIAKKLGLSRAPVGKYLKIITEKRIIPNFLIEKNNSTEDIGTLLTGLKLLSDYLEKSILKPNNLNQPISRLQFINTLK